MTEEQLEQDRSARPEVGAGSPEELALRLWVSPIDVVVHKTPPLEQLRGIAEGRESGFFTMVGISLSLPRHVAAFTFASEAGERAATGQLRVDARFNPPFDSVFEAPVAAMTGTLNSEPVGPDEVFRLAGTVDFILAGGETVRDDPITISCKLDELKKLLIRCSNLADQSWYQLVIWN